MSNLSELLPSGGGQNLVEFVASGTLPSGKAVILKSNGQVETASIASSAISENLISGSIVVYDSSGPCYHNDLDFDPFDSSKFVLIWRDDGDSSKGKAIVGTISGTTITFGTEYIYNAQDSKHANVAFDRKVQNSFMIAYSDGNSTGKAIVGTVSGTALSFGSEATFEGSYINNPALVSDPNNADKFVIIWRGSTSSNAGRSVIATVTGTSISYGTIVNFHAAKCDNPSVHFDPHNANKFIVAWFDASGASNKEGRVRLGTISGTTITFGTLTNFHDATTGVKTNMTVRFDPNTSGRFLVSYIIVAPSYDAYVVVGTVAANESITFGSQVTISTGNIEGLVMQFDTQSANKFIVAYQDSGASGNPTKARVGTMSGTSVTFESETSFGATNTDSRAVVFSPDTASPGKFVHVYNRGGGNARVGQMGSTLYTPNLTATNLLGIASEATSSGDTAKINTWGGINEVQTGLTIGSDYYAQTDGTITTVSTSPAQKVGTAISATTINMKDLT